MPLSDDSGIPQGFERMNIKEPKAKTSSYQGTAKPLLRSHRKQPLRPMRPRRWLTSPRPTEERSPQRETVRSSPGFSPNCCVILIQCLALSVPHVPSLNEPGPASVSHPIGFSQELSDVFFTRKSSQLLSGREARLHRPWERGGSRFPVPSPRPGAGTQDELCASQRSQ